MPIVVRMKSLATSGQNSAAITWVGPADGAGGVEGETVTVELIVVAGAEGRALPFDVQAASSSGARAATTINRRRTPTILAAAA